MHNTWKHAVHRCIKIGLCLALGMIVAGCVTPPMYTHTVDRIHAGRDNIDNINKDAYKTAPTTLTKSEAYIDTQPISLDQPPEWLNDPVTVHGTDLPLNFVVNKILGHTGVFVHYDSTVQSDKKVSINYTGTIGGALENLQVITDYAYDVHDNVVGWSAFQTKTFNIAFLPGKTSFQVGGDSSSGGSTGGSGGSSAQQSTASGLDVGGQYSRLESGTDIWSELEKSLGNLISPQGKIMVSQATTTVTVQDHPAQMARIEKFIEKLNRTLSKQVLLDVQVLDVTLGHAFSYGIDWNLVRGDFSLQGSITPLAPTAVGMSTAAILGFSSTTDAMGNSVPEIAINALKQQGNISVLTQPRVVTLNNQVAAINITAEQGYLASVSSFSGSTGDSVNSSVTPGQVVSGLVLYILPKIEKDEVYLEVSMTIAGTATIENISTVGEGSTTDQGFSQIQVPNQSFQSFNQRAKVPTGNTLVLSGFKRLNQEANKNSLFGIDPLGGKGSQTTNEELVVMITPTILGVPQ